jgi:Sensors of blue-light using FAD
VRNLDGAAGYHTYRVLYFSRACVETAANIEHELRAILLVSQRNNSARNVTGALLSCDGWFMQILEGPRGDVEAALDRIRLDPRHVSLEVLRSGFAPERFFPHWSMCGRSLSPVDNEISRVLEKGGIFDPRRISAAQGVALMRKIQFLQHAHSAGDYMLLD